MNVHPEYAQKIRALIAQRSRLTGNKLFDPNDSQVKARIDQIDRELRRLGAKDVVAIT